MKNILFLNKESPVQGNVTQLSNNTLQILTNAEINTSGFCILTDEGDIFGEYKDYTTLYQKLENGFVLSNNGSVYIKPEPIPEPEPTLEDIKEQKISQMNQIQQEIIRQGVNVTLSNGVTENFTLKDQDQISLMGLQTLAIQGMDKIPWHEADNAEHCKYYSSEDMAMITQTALSFVSYHVTYFRDLRIYINSMADKESVQFVTYGMYVPTEYQSEVLADFYSAQNNA